MDCADPVAVADFWQAAIGFSKRDGDGDPYVTLSESEVGRPLNHLTLQRVPEPKSAKNRAHLDLFARDRRAEVERLVALGATVIAEESPEDVEGDSHMGFIAVVLADPEGHEFCIVGK